MSTDAPVCELLGIERPIVEAPLSADPQLSATRGRLVSRLAPHPQTQAMEVNHE
jgi:hypothetical protein